MHNSCRYTKATPLIHFHERIAVLKAIVRHNGSQSRLPYNGTDVVSPSNYCSTEMAYHIDLRGLWNAVCSSSGCQCVLIIVVCFFCSLKFISYKMQANVRTRQSYGSGHGTPLPLYECHWSLARKVRDTGTTLVWYELPRGREGRVKLVWSFIVIMMRGTSFHRLCLYNVGLQTRQYWWNKLEWAVTLLSSKISRRFCTVAEQLATSFSRPNQWLKLKLTKRLLAK